MSEPVLTIIIPHLNAPDSLARCLESLARQRAEGPPHHVIVVDNGSAERPEKVCELHDFVQLTDEAQPGPGPARSHGTRLARTDLLAFIDCDCIALPGWTSTIVNHFTTHPESGVIGGDVRILRQQPGHATAVEAYESVYGYRMQLYVERDHYTATCNMAVRAEVFRKVGDFGGIGIAEDLDWGRRATALGVRIDYVPAMRIETPARDSFAQLTRKWDRHVGHDYAEVAGLPGRLRWLLKALALAVSPLAEVGRIAASDRLSGLKERALAFLCLARIRLYRSRRMLELLARGDRTGLSRSWRNG